MVEVLGLPQTLNYAQWADGIISQICCCACTKMLDAKGLGRHMDFIRLSFISALPLTSFWALFSRFHLALFLVGDFFFSFFARWLLAWCR